MNTFEIMEDEIAITRQNGVYKQLKMYRRDKRVYIAHGSGFIALRKTQFDGMAFSTSIPSITVVDTTLEDKQVRYERGYAELVK